jgi:DNA-3-methyladenine glycosylase II
MTRRITVRIMNEALAELGARDSDLARAHREAGVPPLRHRPKGFPALVRIICSQQVSVASANAILGRLDAAAAPLTPQSFLALSDDDLKQIGFSRQKTAYVRGLAADLRDDRIDLDGLARLDDEAAIDELTKVKGIGRWSAEIYLLFSLKRPDVWPVDDLAVVVAVQRLKGLAERPDRTAMLEMGEAWRPWRSVAARLMWHYYRTTPAEPA